ncbi:uncharacterized protein A4U43_C08F25840 [Asparagus officinalis]|nr:uncharacterized protein A4U43_C08F25840 [Asparagus officinalis]
MVWGPSADVDIVSGKAPWKRSIDEGEDDDNILSLVDPCNGEFTEGELDVVLLGFLYRQQEFVGGERGVLVGVGEEVFNEILHVEGGVEVGAGVRAGVGARVGEERARVGVDDFGVNGF